MNLLSLIVDIAAADGPCPNGTRAQAGSGTGLAETLCVLPDGSVAMRSTVEPPGFRTDSSLRSGKLHGPYRAWFLNGTLKTEGFYADGKKQGIWYEYGVDGRIRTMTSFKDDVRDGIEIRYSESGDLRWLSFSREGRIVTLREFDSPTEYWEFAYDQAGVRERATVYDRKTNSPTCELFQDGAGGWKVQTGKCDSRFAHDLLLGLL